MKTYLYILVMAATTYLIRVLPLTLIRKPIRSVFLRSFLFYVPYVTLSVMTFPAIMNATQSPIAGAAAMVIGIVAAWCGLGLLPVSLVCCATVLILEHFIVCANLVKHPPRISRGGCFYVFTAPFLRRPRRNTAPFP